MTSEEQEEVINELRAKAARDSHSFRRIFGGLFVILAVLFSITPTYYCRIPNELTYILF